MRLMDYLYARASYNRIPLSGGFELSPVCNFSCRMCYVRRTPAQLETEGKRLKTPEEWLKLARECRDAGMLYLLLSGGEPFAYPGFRELYEQLHDMGIVISINSNGSLIDENTVEWLKKRMPARINITLYGASKETYGRVCGNPVGYEKAMNAINMLRSAGIPVVINASMIPENSADLEKIMSVGKELGINTRVATYMFPPARRESEITDSRLSPEKSAELMLRKTRFACPDTEYCDTLNKLIAIYEEKPEDGDDPGWGEGCGEEMKCRAGRSSFWVNWDGTMTACALTRFPVVTEPFERPFAECWEELNNAVRAVAVLSGCAGCNMRHVCRPCAAMLITETGDENTKAPYLCKMSEETVNLARKELCRINERK